jgi:periplasmic protein TonB
MAYADQDGMGTNRLVSVVIVLLLHAFLGYALVTGLAYDAVISIKEKMTVVDVKVEEPPEEEEEPPPEPEKQIEPPVVSPPPMVVTVTPPPTIRTVDTPPPAAPIVPTAAPPAPPPPAVISAAKPRGNPSNWANTNDYPSRALQQEREGTTGFRVTIGTNGRVIDCSVTQSSGHADLDEATCKNIERRARFTPALRNGEPVQGSYSNRVRWQIPK